MESLNVFLEQGRDSSHPSRMQWDLFLLQSLSASEHNTLEQHLHGCDRCRQKFNGLQAERTMFQDNIDLPLFVQTMQEKVAHAPVAELLTEVRDNITTAAHSQELLIAAPKEPQEPVKPVTTEEPAGWLDWLQRLTRPMVLAPMGAFALMMVVLFSYNNTDPNNGGGACLPLDVPGIPGVRTKGNSPELNVYLFRKGQRSNAQSGAHFFPNDILALRYKSSGYKYLSVVYVDHKGKVGFLYPARPAPSLAVHADGDLDGSIQLDAAKGTERLLAFFSTRALQPEQVKALIQNKPGQVRLSCASPNNIYLRELTILKK